MKYLLIDTSTNALIIILHDQDKKIDELIRYGRQDHQAHIIPMMEEILAKHQLKPQDLEGVIVGVGPGSYTGLRVGVMTAKMLGYAAHINVYKISSLVFLTSGYPNKVLAWHDARNNQGFSATIQAGVILDKEKVRHEEELSSDDLKRRIILNNDTIKIDGNIIIKNKILVEDIYKLIPNYLRKTQAEKDLDQKSKS